MWNRCSSAGDDPRLAGGVTLKTVWQVRGDTSYDVVRRWQVGRHLVALRTIRGKGVIYGECGEPVEVEAGSLLFFEDVRVNRYRCVAPDWHFWWFEFTVEGPVGFPFWVPVKIPLSRIESLMCLDIFSALRRTTPAQRGMASAGLLWLLQRWRSSVAESGMRRPHEAAITRVIDAMHERVDRLWSVGEMARMAGLGERRFRHVFAAATGQSPKRFHEGLRLEFGRQLLMAGRIKLDDVAARTGFSSAFHFSRAYKKRFGHPPSLAERL